MFRLVVFAYLLMITYGANHGPIPGIGQSPIIGGEQANIEEAPYQVALLMDPIGIGSYGLRCGGSIISPTTILTAGHCNTRTTAVQWRVRAGSSAHASGGTIFSVSKVITHANYSSPTYDYDVGLLLLSSAIAIDDITTKISILPAQGAPIETGSIAFVTGWGSTVSGGSSTTQLRKVNVPVVDQDICVTTYSGLNDVTDRMVCAGDYANGGIDACHGDSGGPFVVDGIQVGITSWGYDCGLPKYPGVWTRVPAFIDWINSNA